MHPCPKGRNKFLWDYTKTQVWGLVSFGNLAPLVDPALFNSSYKVCLWKCLCRSGHGVVGQPVRVCWLGKVTSFVYLSCSARIQGLSSFYPGTDFSKNVWGLRLGDFHPCLTRGWPWPTAYKPLWGCGDLQRVWSQKTCFFTKLS